MYRLAIILFALLALAGIANAQTTAFDCSGGFNSSMGTPCGIGIVYPINGYIWNLVGGTSGCNPAVTGSQVNLSCVGTQHSALSLIWQTRKVSTTNFNTTFTFIPNGYNMVFFLNNSTNNPGGQFNNNYFAAGAGCEADFFQGFSQANPPNNVFAVDFESWQPFANNGTFSYSSVQIYQSNVSNTYYPNTYVQCPCFTSVETCGTNTSPADNSYPITKLSTSPVPLNSPSGTSQTSTGDTYSANLVYNGTTLTLNLFDVTAGGTCTPNTSPSCYTHSWTADGTGAPLNIPNAAGGNTAWVGVGGAIPSINPTYALYITGFKYIEGSAGNPVGGPGQKATGGMW